MHGKLNFHNYNQLNTLDISSLPETVKGEALRLAIFNAVKDTQSVVVQQLPNELVMTKAQFDNLNPYGDMRYFGTDDEINPYKPKDYVWVTPMNAMDIVVKDPDSFIVR